MLSLRLLKLLDNIFLYDSLEAYDLSVLALC